MEEDLVRQQSEESVHRTVPGMESVVATVSGYHGSERFKLIKIISQAGGSYVGRLNQSTTHLVCWKFEGRKYELARKMKTKIVNHRWFEDCIVQGRFLPEHPYTLICGKEVGPLRLDIPVVASPSIPDQSNAWNDSTEPVIDITGEDTDHAVWVDSRVLKENLFPELGRSKNRFDKSKRKQIKKSLMRDNSSGTRYCSEEPSLSGSKRVEIEELSSPSTQWTRQKKRNTTSAGTSRKGRLVKNDMDEDILEPFYDSEQENDPLRIHHRQNEIIAPSSSSRSGRNKGILRVTQASNERVYAHNEGLENAEDIEDLNDLSFEDSLHANDGSSSLATKNHCVAVDEDFNDKEPRTRLPKSTELSCVICWTDFSSTRGVLPCGHRFCFSCIQSWADHMASSRKTSTCPLCKASFVSITKVDEALSADQKIYSQTIPRDPLNTNVYILPNTETPILRASTSLAPVCCHCCCREPEDLLIRCQLCQIRCVHSYCLDPPMTPWTCVHCRDLRMFYHQIR
ncbi:hypothetical protein LguiB_009102 [Lonicera macranthoides]